MPRLSLYKPEKGQDYKFIDRQISEMFQAGGTDVYLHKYLGPKSPSDANATADQPQYGTDSVTNIQDLLFLENRDRKYDSNVYTIRGLYNVQNIDFNLSQFGLFIDNDTLFMTIHINDFINYIGRKPISGDVLELPHLRDEFALNSFDVSLPRYYVIEDVGRASEGFSATWYPHLYRLKLKKITDNQQFADILDTPAGLDMDRFRGEYDPLIAYVAGAIVRKEGVLYEVTADTPAGTEPPNTDYFSVYSNSIKNILSTRAKELEINQSVLDQAEADAPLSGYETRHFFTLAVDETGKTLLQPVDANDPDAGTTNARPKRSGYTGYLVGDGYPPNGFDFGHGIQFPQAPLKNDYFLRTDMLPNRLFRYDGVRWVKIEDSIRHTMTNTDARQTHKTAFINNKNITGKGVADEGRFTASSVISTIQTTTAYQSTMGAKVMVGDVWVVATVSQDQSGNAVINLNSSASAGSSVSWTLYQEYFEERQSITKALKPKADL